MEHPEYARAGVKMSQFSFQIPKPLQENYVRKRVPKAHTSHDTPKALEPRAGMTMKLMYSLTCSVLNRKYIWLLFFYLIQYFKKYIIAVYS